MQPVLSRGWDNDVVMQITRLKNSLIKRQRKKNGGKVKHDLRNQVEELQVQFHEL